MELAIGRSPEHEATNDANIERGI
ncbi:MAG: hypothetical protein H6Q34_993, partial [Deltaproteobacteria bacterium]|nr:hypothetical protein [Deltaproteobacteria bacterium]